MDDALYQRTALLLDEEKLRKVKQSNILILGVGGVGSYAAEQLCRAGAGRLTLLDGDRVDATNLNRQLPALTDTVGKLKAEVLAERFRKINPAGEFTAECRFITPEDVPELLERDYDVMIDAIDDVPAKVAFLAAAVRSGKPVVSVMGAGGKSDITMIRHGDISKTFGCPLCKKVRSKLRELEIKHGIYCIFSPEERVQTRELNTIGSISYLPAAFGCHAAAAALQLLWGSE